MRNIQIPLNTSYAWDISHALATLYHPYTNNPSALTEYLKRKLRVQRAKRRSRSHPTQVEPNIPLERNIGYPWLATFEPKFGWKDAIIETKALPIIISSTHPVDSRTVIAGLQTNKEKEDIVQELEETTTIRGIATELAIQAGEGKKKVEIPAVYDRFQRLFSEEASQ